MLQISKEEFYQFREEIRTEFARIYGRMDKIEAQIQALNQRIDAIEKRIDDMRSETNTKINIIITIFTAMFAAVLGLLGVFLYSWISFIREHKEKKADKEEVIKLQEKIKELEAQRN